MAAKRVRPVRALGRMAGFSLIELVIVIVILGILAVTALPRFLDVTDEAKKASVEGVSGGFATGVSLVRAQWEAEGRARQDGLNTVLYDGSRFYLTTPTDSQVSNGELSLPGIPWTRQQAARQMWIRPA